MKVFMSELTKNTGHFGVFGLFVRVFTLCSLFMLCLPAQAQGDMPLDQLFTIRNIKVDETARSAADARLTALAKAEVEAYQKLLNKLTQPDARARLPELSIAQRQALISGIELVDEQTSSRRYLATLNVRFEPSLVSDFFAEYEVPHVLAAGRPILVVHSHRRGMQSILWEPDTTLRQARDSVDWANRIRAYVFPRGEMRERLSLTAGEIEDRNVAAALRVGKFNTLNSALILSTKVVTKAGGSAVLTYQFYATDSDLSGEGEIDLNGADAASEIDGLIDIYELVLDQIDTAWRERLLVDTGEQGSLDVVIPSQSFERLREIERRLSEITLVQALSIKKIGIPLTRITLDYTGKQEQLSLALRFAGLDLKPYGADMMIDLRDQ